MGSLLSSFQSQDNIAGYHILHVQENSPAEKAGLEEFFDFITGVNHIQMVGSDEVLLALLNASVDQPTVLTVYSCRTKQSREVSITPQNDWGGKGILGLTIRFCSVKEAMQNVRRILKVCRDSPAEAAGLKAYTDYIIATDSSLLSNDDSFASFIKKFDKTPLMLFVFNIEDATCRLVEIIPNTNWGGDGALGCVIESSSLQQIAMETTQTPLAIARFAIKSIFETVIGVEPASEVTETNKEEKIVASNELAEKNEDLFGTPCTNGIEKKFETLTKSLGVRPTEV